MRTSLPLALARTTAGAVDYVWRDGEQLRDACGLTPREVEVLLRLADGLSTREIARALFITEDTVKDHIDHIIEKVEATGYPLGSNKRASLVAFAFHAGYVN